jgi:aspartyl-tRNA(Asn)/glutamyl-tRNA(Gln) amidotransferase subunit B
MTEPYRVHGETGDWEVVIGLEVHAQVTSASKLFSGASATYGAEPNAHVSLVDAAMPGMLPVINGACVAQAVRTGLALGCEIHRWSRFDRKNYFYADLPQGYQISQFQHPIVGEGAVTVELEGGATKTIGVERLHLEQDAGKSIHDAAADASLVDLNRSGIALMEIVSKPDMRSPAEAGAYVRHLRETMRYAGTCDGNMDEGSMRADVNVSVRRPGDGLGTRTETKNVNSVRFIEATIAYEARRQVEVIEAGGAIVQETRLFDPERGVTRSMRSKEDAHDYRYFPDPDLPPLVFDDAFVDACRASLPELPGAKRARYEGVLGLSAYQAAVLVADVETAAWFEVLLHDAARAAGRSQAEMAKAAANWMISDLFGGLNKRGVALAASPVAPVQGAALLALIADGTLSGPLAKQVFEAMLETGRDPLTIVEERGLRQVSDTGAIDAAVTAVMAANPDKLAEYRSGKDKLFGFFVGQVMKAMAGKANPAVVNDAVRRALDAPSPT